ncbi:hypothetical protein ACJO2E_14180 [Marinobacter sp. M1N3S26]|uniref:hypothetical protein n=1 Tax=Marinobacter sp. M1N3S26 TaxID=3382299 RepID=UPI00387A9270
MTIQIFPITGNDILPYLDDVAQLRIEVFRSFLYLLFFSHRGYQLVPGLTAGYAWTDVGDQEQTAKPMQFWTRRLS